MDRGILGLAFIMFGSIMVFQYEKAKAIVPWASIGLSEILGGLGLILPFVAGIVPTLTPIAAIALDVIIVLVTGYHVKRKEYHSIGTPIIFLALLIFVAIGRW